jgi:hypothetical protein
VSGAALPAMVCGTCRQVLDGWRDEASGQVTYRHTLTGLRHGAAADHQPRPVPATQVAPADRVGFCDFCSAPAPRWAYTTAPLSHSHPYQVPVVDPGEVHTRTWGGRHREVSAREAGRWGLPGTHVQQNFSEGWAACDECAPLIEARDLLGLVARASEAMPRKYTAGGKLVRVRAELRQMYEPLFAQLRPGRSDLTRGGAADHPA